MRYPYLTFFPLFLVLSSCHGPERQSPASGTKPQISPSDAASSLIRDIYAASPEVVRYDRYTLISTAPAHAQRDLLNQMTDIKMPPETIRTVGDALHYSLLETGWSLCADSGSLSVLYDRPLPSVHRHLGPVRLSEALQLLAGPAWQMKADQVLRQICFSLRTGFTAPSAIKPAPATTAKIAPSQPVLEVKKVVTPAQAQYHNIDIVRLKSDTAIPEWSPRGSGKATLPVVLKRILPAGWKADITPEVKKTPSGHATVLNWQGDRDWRAALNDLVQKNHWRASINPDTRTVVITPATPSAPLTTITPSKTPTPKPTTVPAVATTAPQLQKPLITPVWKAEPGTTLRKFLTSQASTVTCPTGGHWTVFWPENIDYPISAPLIFHGNFESLLNQLFTLYGPGRVDTPLYAKATRSQCLVAVSDKPGNR